MDKIEYGLSNRLGLRVIYADVTETATALESRHLAGPASSRILGQGLTAAALLLSRTKSGPERVSFQMKVDGPIKGILAESSHEGGLRGYTDIKLLDEFDDLPEMEESTILGKSGHLRVIHSNDKKVLHSGHIDISPPDVRTALARYFNQSEQVPTAVELYSAMEDYRVKDMKGLVIQKMPGADTEEFVRLLEMFDSKAVLGRLKESSGLADLKELFSVDDLSLLQEKRLSFSCGCSHKKSVDIMAMLPDHELHDLVKSRASQVVTCHFCGESYKVSHEDISKILLNKADMEKPVN